MRMGVPSSETEVKPSDAGSMVINNNNLEINWFSPHIGFQVA
jgi:hypothetical protein